jgi:chemotaxis-related protein WspD
MTECQINDCWNKIGVQGSKTCPELSRYIHCRNCPVFEKNAQLLLDREAPPGYVEEWTEFLAQGKQAEIRDTEVVMVFRIGAEWLALPAALCVEIISVRPLRPIPHHANRILQGIVSVRGEMHLCFSLAELLALDTGAPAVEARSGKSIPRLIVARQDRFGAVFPVDEVMGLQRYAPDAVRAVPATVAHAVPQFSRGLLAADGRDIGLLDENLIFHALEQVLQ